MSVLWRPPQSFMDVFFINNVTRPRRTEEEGQRRKREGERTQWGINKPKYKKCEAAVLTDSDPLSLINFSSIQFMQLY